VLNDPLYQHALGKAGDRLTHFSEANRMNIFLLLKFFLPRIPFGHIIEFGSFRGGSAIFMAAVCEQLFPDRLIWALDTFAGMPPTDKRVDAHSEGDFRGTSLAEVQGAVAAAGLRNIRLVQGLFHDTAVRALADAGPIALAKKVPGRHPLGEWMRPFQKDAAGRFYFVRYPANEPSRIGQMLDKMSGNHSIKC
jgi:hypothetical protein